MTPDQLITFAAVAEHGNISRAAVALHLSQSAVSGQLRLLQDEFGEPLYLRAGRGVRLTPAGEHLAVYAATLRATYRDARAYRDALRGLERGALRIGASTTPASYLLPYLIADFQRRYPAVTVQATSGNTADIVGLLASLDVALVEGAVGELATDTDVRVWREDEIVAIAPRGHPLLQRAAKKADAPDATAANRQNAQNVQRALNARHAQGARNAQSARNPRHACSGQSAQSAWNTHNVSFRETVELAAIGAWPLVLREAGSGLRQVVERAFARAAVPMRIALEIAGVEGVKEAVRAGMGIGFVSAMSMRREDATLCASRLGPAPLTRRFSILVPHAHAVSRATQRFLALCADDVQPPQSPERAESLK